MFKVKAPGQGSRSKRTKVNVQGQGLRSKNTEVKVQAPCASSIFKVKTTKVKFQGKKGWRIRFKVKVQCQKGLRSRFKVKVHGQKDGGQG